MRTAVLPASILALAAVAACDPNAAGKTGATLFGDTSHQAEHGSPTAALRAACGDGQPTAAGVALKRQPYLQQVTSGSAMVGWVSVDPAGEHVRVTSPATVVPAMTPAMVASVVETQSDRPAGENQMWTTIGQLTPSTIYCYEPLAGTTPLNDPTGFRTAPAADDPAPVRFLAFGDSGGGGADQMELRDQMREFPYELIIHTGDVAYDNGSIQQFEDNVFGVYAELFRNLPFFPSAGNHEYETLQGAPFRDVFALPGDSGEKWYSYDWGRVHFAALDTESDYATQAAWLDRDLAASTAPWKIVYMHRPPYSSGRHGSDIPLRNLLAPVLEKHHVHLVLAGHDHSYERMIPQNGINYVVTGGGGVGTYEVGASDFTAFSESVIHFVYVEVGLDELILHAVDAEGTEFDSLVVERVPS